MQYTYPIDATIFSILFDIRDEKTAQKVYEEFTNIQEQYAGKFLVDFLIEKGFDEKYLETYFNSPNLNSPEIDSLTVSDEFLLYVRNKANELNKRLYDERVPLLSEENKSALRNYLNDLQQDMDSGMKLLMDNLDIKEKVSSQGVIGTS